MLRSAREVTSALAVCAVAIGAGGCAESGSQVAAVSPSPPESVAPHLAAGLEGSLDERGLFKAEVLAAAAPSEEISSERARALAAAFMRTHGRGLKRILEIDRQGSVDIASLRACGRTYYAESPYQPLPSEVPAPFRRIVGSWWLVTLCGGAGERQVSVAVSTRSTADVGGDGGVIYRPFEASHNFAVLGIPRRLGALPPEPEHAVTVTAALTGRRITAAPRLLAPAINQYPQMARWVVPLDGETSGWATPRSGSRRPVLVSQVYFGANSFVEPEGSYTAAAEQPPEQLVSWYPAGPDGTLVLTAPRRTTRPERRSNVPTAFDRFVVGGR